MPTGENIDPERRVCMPPTHWPVPELQPQPPRCRIGIWMVRDTMAALLVVAALVAAYALLGYVLPVGCAVEHDGRVFTKDCL
jgi:hypothetical protein